MRVPLLTEVRGWKRVVLIAILIVLAVGIGLALGALGFGPSDVPKT